MLGWRGLVARCLKTAVGLMSSPAAPQQLKNVRIKYPDVGTAVIPIPPSTTGFGPSVIVTSRGPAASFRRTGAVGGSCQASAPRPRDARRPKPAHQSPPTRPVPSSPSPHQQGAPARFDFLPVALASTESARESGRKTRRVSMSVASHFLGRSGAHLLCRVVSSSSSGGGWRSSVAVVVVEEGEGGRSGRRWSCGHEIGSSAVAELAGGF